MQQCLKLVTLDYSHVVSISVIYTLLEERDNLKDLNIDGRVLFGFGGSGHGPVTGCFEHGKVPAGFHKMQRFS
jgi:hypothetical protein